MDALYFRVSSDRQTTENQFDELIRAARAGDPARDWERIRAELGRSVIAETRTTHRGATRTVYRVDEAIARRLADRYIYIEQGASGAAGKRRPLFDRMRKDAALRKFDRVLVWKVSRLGRDMREVISTAYELSDVGVTIIPLKSQTGPLNTAMGRLLWCVHAWFSEMENEERSENVKAGQARARAQGKEIGRPREIDAAKVEQIAGLRALGLGYSAIAKAARVSRTTVRRILRTSELKAA